MTIFCLFIVHPIYGMHVTPGRGELNAEVVRVYRKVPRVAHYENMHDK